MPRTAGFTSALPRNGSSPERYSKFRPFRGTRATLRPGPSSTLAPFSKNSLPMPAPHSCRASTSHVAAIERPDGQAVEVPSGSPLGTRKPCGPSFMVIGGTFSRGMPGTFPMYAQAPGSPRWCRSQLSGPCSMESFSARVRFATSRRARSPGGSERSDQGPCVSSAQPGGSSGSSARMRAPGRGDIGTGREGSTGPLAAASAAQPCAPSTSSNGAPRA
mmetsp:Transcript_17483/g.38548  ORF Transcript_17483/g.38548 Transcript_17483/m.38548 type:complete len:218 (-) Transcript_17483:2-655(-)